MLQQGQVFRLSGGDGRDEWRFATGTVAAARDVCSGTVSRPSATRARRSSGHWNGCAVSEAAANALTLAEFVRGRGRSRSTPQGKALARVRFATVPHL